GLGRAPPKGRGQAGGDGAQPTAPALRRSPGLAWLALANGAKWAPRVRPADGRRTYRRVVGARLPLEHEPRHQGGAAPLPAPLEPGAGPRAARWSRSPAGARPGRARHAHPQGGGFLGSALP